MPEPQLEVIAITRAGNDQLRGFHLDLPVAGGTSQTVALNFAGWVAGAASPALEVSLFERGFDAPGFELAQAAVNLPRPDVLAAYPDARNLQPLPGYSFDVAIPASRETFVCTLLVTLADGSRIPLHEITIRAAALASYQPRHRPLLLTSTGRSGSTYVLGLLGRHPQIVAHHPHTADPRVASYWATVFGALAQPASYLQQLSPSDPAQPQWFLGSTPPGAIADAQDAAFLGQTGVRALADFCLARMDAFYDHACASQNRPDALYFVEKFSLRPARSLVRALCPLAREVVLVRDFRDVLTSVLAFNRKRGFTAFGREKVNSDVEYIAYLAQAVGRLETILADPHRPAHLLRYEHLVRQPQAALRKLLDFLQLDAADATIQSMLQPPDAQTLAAHRTTADPVASIGRWRTELSPELRAACRAQLDASLIRLGYDPTN